MDKNLYISFSENPELEFDLEPFNLKGYSLILDEEKRKYVMSKGFLCDISDFDSKLKKVENSKSLYSLINMSGDSLILNENQISEIKSILSIYS